MNLLGDPALKAPVEVPPTDLPPTLSVNPAGTNKSVAADSTLSFAVTATDPDGLAVSLSAADLPAGATAPATSRTASVTTTFDWTPSTNQIGVVDVVDGAHRVGPLGATVAVVATSRMGRTAQGQRTRDSRRRKPDPWSPQLPGVSWRAK